MRVGSRYTSAWLSLTLLALIAPAWSQPYPARPIRIIVPISAGSVTDVAARLIAQDL